MWSLIYRVEVILTKSKSYQRTKKCKNGSWNYCMEEVTNNNECDKYDEYFISYNKTSVDDCRVSLDAWPSVVDNPSFKVGYRTSIKNAASACENYLLFARLLEKTTKYNELDKDTKILVDEYIDKNYLKVKDGIIKFIPPVISENNLLKLDHLIENDDTLQKALNKYSPLVYKEVEKLFPSYLHDQLPFIVSAFTVTERSLIINYAYNMGLLSLDEVQKHFVYNMMIILK